MATVEAEYFDRREIRFETRGRTLLNVRAPAEDGSGPQGHTSVELLLIAVGNCTLGHLLNSPPLDTAEVTRATASVEATMAEFPRRVAHVHSTVVIEVTDPALLEQQAAIEGGSCGGPMCAALGDLLSATVTLTLRP
jgi:hypothetical protein